ncbi:MAG: lipid-A-disaccharide synthase [Cyclobacteriaceae bacterium]|nr:lipid-A-disaccharide synthase [Cyclobacteriaceae bacterium]
MKYYLIAGERSGDLHASNLMKALKGQDSNAEFRFWGGDYMQAVGGEMVVHYRQLAFMGFLEVLLNLFTISKLISQCKKDILVHKPDVLVLVDYGGFNLKIAKYAKSIGLTVVYYISPKVWAWNQKRAYKIKDRVDKMLCILPFEVEFYKKFDWEVEYVGNPVVEAVKDHKLNPHFIEENKLEKDKELVAVLPGSRKQELVKILPTIATVIAQFPDQQFVVAGVNNLPIDLYEPILKFTNVALIFEQTYDLLSFAKAAIVCSGTATLETALFKTPQVVIYKTSPISYAIGKRVVKVKYMSLVNLIVDEEIVPELLQHECTTERITKELQHLLINGTDYKLLTNIIGNKVASIEAARNIKYLCQSLEL